MKTVFITLVLLFGATAAHELTRSKRLTAFGKTPEVTQPPLVGKGKECKSDEECAHIVFSSCKVDDRDSRRRCICNDGTPIKNGQCVNRPRVRRGYVPSGPRREEKDLVLFKPAPTPPFFPNPEKIKSANGTTTTRKPLFVPHIRLGIRENCKNDGECLEGGECKINPNATTPQERRTKVCLCREGRIELNNQCNGCDRNSNIGHMMMAFGIFSILLNWRGL